MAESVWIFAYKHNGEYVPDDIVGTPEESYANLEYGDVNDGLYQLWEYPSGKIYGIEPDRELKESDNYYATTNDGTKWAPKLVERGIDKDKVTKTYKAMTNNPQ